MEKIIKPIKINRSNFAAYGDLISAEDIKLLGFDDSFCLPHWLICEVLPISPPAVRPSVKQGNSQRMDDDLTHKLSEIIKYNNILKKKIEYY